MHSLIRADFSEITATRQSCNILCHKLGISVRTSWKNNCSLVVTDTNPSCQFDLFCNTGSAPLVAQLWHVSFCRFASCQCWLSLLKRCPPGLNKLRMRSALFAKMASLRFLVPVNGRIAKGRNSCQGTGSECHEFEATECANACERLWIKVKLIFAVKYFWAR